MITTRLLIGAAALLIFAAVVIVREIKRVEKNDHWHHD